MILVGNRKPTTPYVPFGIRRFGSLQRPTPVTRFGLLAFEADAAVSDSTPARDIGVPPLFPARGSGFPDLMPHVVHRDIRLLTFFRSALLQFKEPGYYGLC